MDVLRLRSSVPLPAHVLTLVLVLMIGAALGGCGGGGGGGQIHAPRRAIQAQSHAVAPAYRWLLPVSGPPPSTAAENRNQGTRAWRLPGPDADVGGLAHGSVSGYVAEQALGPGQTERIYVNAPRARWVRIRIFRIGWYSGTGGREVLASNRLRIVRQPRCAHHFDTGLTECRWHPTLTFRIPSALPTGVYVAKLATRSGESDCLFVVRGERGPTPLLAQLPTATYEAYNAWGGDSLYPGGADRVRLTGTTRGVEVSYHRPYDSVTGAGQFFARDVAMVRFLERYRYPISYTTSESVDAEPSQLAGHRALIDFGHSEYWSARQAHGFAAALARGTSLLLFGSDTLAWRVRFAPARSAAGQAAQPGQTIVAYKQSAGLARSRPDRSGVFADRGAGLAGSAYLGCITPRLHAPGPPTYRYYSWSPAALKPSWLFAGTGVSLATRIPGIVGYELDARTSSTPPGTQLVGGGVAPCIAAAEPGAPLRGLGYGAAESTLYQARSGAIVFDSGTLGWELGLEPVPSASPDAPRAPDPRLVALTRNLLREVLRRSGGRQ